MAKYLNIKIARLFAVISASIFILVNSAVAQEVYNASSIVIDGIKRVEEDTVISYLEVKVGDKITKDNLNSSIKRLYSTGLFSEVFVRSDKEVIYVKVIENPVINKVAFENNLRLNDEDLEPEVGLRSRSVYTKEKVQSDVERIKSLYRNNGRFNVVVDPKIIQLGDNKIDVVFEIDEGKKSKIGKVYFTGNEYFSSDKLASRISSKEKRWYNFLSSDDSYDPDRVAFDEEMLRRFYFSEGFADFRVLSSTAEMSDDQESFILTFSLEEGVIYDFGEVTIKSQIKDIDTNELESLLEVKSNDTYNAKLIDKDVDRLTEKLNDLGYAFVEVESVNRKADGDRIDIMYRLNESAKFYVNEINIRGNSRTLDKVIRREFRLQEGDPFNAAKLRNSQRNIRNLGFFDKVEIKRNRSDISDKTDIQLDVSERPTGELNFGAGFSSSSGALGNIGVRERNLLGKGQDLRLNLQRSSRGADISLGFTEPYFMERDLSVGFDIFNNSQGQEDESSFDKKTLGATIRGSYTLKEDLRHVIRYSLSTIEVTNIQSDASTFVRQQEGKNTTSLIGHSLIYDKRDNRADPSKGYFVRFNQDLAGFGGDSKYFKNELQSAYYYPLYRDDVIFSLSGKGGHIFGIQDKDVRIDQRFFVGNTQIRGFDDAGIGPRDSATTDSLGGNSYYVGSAEIMFPIGLPEELGVKGAVFTDVGSLFGVDATGPGIQDEASLRASAGFGFSWKSPFGPVRIDFSNAFIKESFDKTQTVRFNFGTRF